MGAQAAGGRQAGRQGGIRARVRSTVVRAKMIGMPWALISAA